MATVLGVALVIGAPTANAQLVSSVESKCSGTIGKGSSKLAKTYAKEVAKCLDSDISGSTVGACPNAGNLEKIAKAATKVTDGVLKKCKSTCSISQLPCIANTFCPPLPDDGAAEECSAGAANEPFKLHNIGFPGAFCEVVLGGQIASGEDIGTCVSEKSEDGGEALINVVYGSITNASSVSPAAAACLKGISKAAQKLFDHRLRRVSSRSRRHPHRQGDRQPCDVHDRRRDPRGKNHSRRGQARSRDQRLHGRRHPRARHLPAGPRRRDYEGGRDRLLDSRGQSNW